MYITCTCTAHIHIDIYMDGLSTKQGGLACVQYRYIGCRVLCCRQGFQPCFEAGIRELPFLMPEPAEKPSLHFVANNIFTAELATDWGTENN